MSGQTRLSHLFLFSFSREISRRKGKEHGSNAFHVTLCSVREVCTKELHRETRLFIEGHKLPVPFSTYHEIYAPKERVQGSYNRLAVFLFFSATRPAGFRLSSVFTAGWIRFDNEKSWWPQFRDTPAAVSRVRAIQPDAIVDTIKSFSRERDATNRGSPSILKMKLFSRSLTTVVGFHVFLAVPVPSAFRNDARVSR